MDFLSLLAAGGVLAAIITAVSVITQIILNKKLRTPADANAEISLILQYLKEGVNDSRADRKALEETLRDLRIYVSKLETESRESFALRVSLERRIADLENRITEKDERIREYEERILYLENELRKYTTVDSTVEIETDSTESD